jgi:hypothetical protein
VTLPAPSSLGTTGELRQPLYDWDDNDYVDDYPKPMNDKNEGSYYPKGPHNFVYADSDNDSTKQEPA